MKGYFHNFPAYNMDISHYFVRNVAVSNSYNRSGYTLLIYWMRFHNKCNNFLLMEYFPWLFHFLLTK